MCNPGYPRYDEEEAKRKERAEKDRKQAEWAAYIAAAQSHYEQQKRIAEHNAWMEKKRAIEAASVRK